jgi:energy-converting hydrogenase Eha subunit E
VIINNSIIAHSNTNTIKGLAGVTNYTYYLEVHAGTIHSDRYGAIIDTSASNTVVGSINITDLLPTMGSTEVTVAFANLMALTHFTLITSPSVSSPVMTWTLCSLLCVWHQG